MAKFIASSQNSKELLNSATLLKDMNVHVLIKAEAGCGKKILAKHILPNSEVYDSLKLQDDIKNDTVDIVNKEIIVTHIESITNIDMFIGWASRNSIRVVATTTQSRIAPKLEEDFFHIVLNIPNLKNRKEDVEKLADLFKQEAKQILDVDFDIDNISYDLSTNAISLRRSIYLTYFTQNISKDELLQLLQNYFLDELENNKYATYKEMLSIFEIPLLNASKKLHKNQLQMAKSLDITRVTLRKKLESYKKEVL